VAFVVGDDASLLAREDKLPAIGIGCSSVMWLGVELVTRLRR
jgi:hypothetical protein